MVHDELTHAARYAALHPLFAKGFELLKSGQLNSLPDGKHLLDGEKLWASISRYTSKPEGKWEAHRRYIDIQYIVSGAEQMGVVGVQTLTPVGEFDTKGDYVFFKDPLGQASVLTVRAGQFAIFWPQDAHMPMLQLGAPSPIHKIVLKVEV